LITRSVRSSPTAGLAHYPYPKDIHLTDDDLDDDTTTSIYLKKSLKNSTILQSATKQLSRNGDFSEGAYLKDKGQVLKIVGGGSNTTGRTVGQQFTSERKMENQYNSMPLIRDQSVSIDKVLPPPDLFLASRKSDRTVDFSKTHAGGKVNGLPPQSGEYSGSVTPSTRENGHNRDLVVRNRGFNDTGGGGESGDSSKSPRHSSKVDQPRCLSSHSFARSGKPRVTHSASIDYCNDVTDRVD